MSDHTTSIGNDAAGPVLSGTFNGAVALLHEARQASQELPAELQNINLRSFQLATARAVMDLSERMQGDDRDRLERQKETDIYRDAMAARLGGIEALIKHMMIALSIVQVILVLAMAGLVILYVVHFWG